MESPIFIVGTGRSGTSMLRLILNAHSHIAVPPELTYFNRYQDLGIEKWDHPDITEAQYRTFVGDFLERRIRGRVLDEASTRELEEKILEDGVRDLRQPFMMALEAYARQHGKKRWGEKSPPHLLYADVMHAMFPDARFILVVRDPRAGVRSMNNVPFFPDDVVFNALHRRHYEKDGYSLLERSVPAGQRMVVRYEDLVASPQSEVATICDFLEEPFEPEMLDFHREAQKHLPPVVYTKQLSQPISTSSLDKWKRHLTPSEVGVIELLCAEEMTRFGYEPMRTSPTVQDLLEAAVKWLYWKVYRLRMRKQRAHRAPVDGMFPRTRKRLNSLFNRAPEA